MLNTTDKIIKHKTGLLNLAEELGNVSKACQVEVVRKHPPRAVWLFSGQPVYRVSLWTPRKTPAVFKFYRSLIPAAVAAGRMTRKSASLRKVMAGV